MTTPAPPAASPLTKRWYLSKTVMFNGVLTIIGVGSFLAEPKNDPTLTVASISAAVVGIANVALRVWFTDTAIG